MIPRKYWDDLCRLVDTVAPVYDATETPPDSWRELREWYLSSRGLRPIPVYDVSNSERLVMPTVHHSHAFRAWHDTLHIMLHANFNLVNERKVAEAHAETALRCGYGSHVAALAYFVSAANVSHIVETKAGPPEDEGALIDLAFCIWQHGNDSTNYHAALSRAIWLMNRPSGHHEEIEQYAQRFA